MTTFLYGYWRLIIYAIDFHTLKQSYQEGRNMFQRFYCLATEQADTVLQFANFHIELRLGI